jgi:hypothetical protein
MSQSVAALIPTAVDYERTLVLAIEVSNKNWVLAAQVPGLAHTKTKRTIEPDAEALLAAIVGYRARATATGRSIERVSAGRRRKTRSVVPRRAFCQRFDGREGTFHRGRARGGDRPVHASYLRSTRRKGAPANQRAHQGGPGGCKTSRHRVGRSQCAVGQDSGGGGQPCTKFASSPCPTIVDVGGE